MRSSRAGTETRPLLIVRADANAAIGSGHAKRSAAVAEEWHRRDLQFALVTSGSLESVPTAIRRRASRIETGFAAHPDPEDLDRLLRMIGESQTPCVLLDGYGFDEEYRRAIRQSGATLIVMDDNGSQASHAHVVVNSSPSADRTEYRGIAVESLVGPAFAPLRSEFMLQSRKTGSDLSEPPRILVTLGGSDRLNRTAMVIEALELTSRRVQARVVIGPANTRKGELLEKCSSASQHIECIVDPPDMSALMAWSDIAVCASGGTLLEIAFLGVPSLSLVLAENQRKIGETFADSGVTRNLGSAEQLTARGIADALTEMLENQEIRRAQTIAGQSLIDGLGTSRIVDHILGFTTVND